MSCEHLLIIPAAYNLAVVPNQERASVRVEGYQSSPDDAHPLELMGSHVYKDPPVGQSVRTWYNDGWKRSVLSVVASPKLGSRAQECGEAVFVWQSTPKPEPMSTRTSRVDLYQIQTESVIRYLKHGSAIWRKPWDVSVGRPHNFQTGNAYQGINALRLGWAMYDSPWWMTLQQVMQSGGSIRDRQTGCACPVMRWGSSKTSEELGDGSEVCTTRYFLKYYWLYNEAHIEGISFPSLKSASHAQRGKRVTLAQSVYGRMPQKPALVESRRNRAGYRWQKDEVEIPPFASFASPAEYYLCLFHQLIHSSGHPTRLNRPGVTESDGKSGKVYTQEELTAEMGAAFLASETEMVPNDNRRQSAAYIAKWIAALSKPNHCRWVVIAANQAAAAVEYILGSRDAGNRGVRNS